MINLMESVLQEKYELLPPKVVYHGSKKSVVTAFKHQTGKRAAFFDVKEVMSNGFFFAQNPKDASTFGPYVGAYHIDLRRPLVTGADGIDGIRDAKREADVRYVLGALMVKQDDGHYVFNGMQNDIWAHPDHIDQSPGPDNRDDDWIYHFMGSGGLDWEVLDHPEAVRRMVERGYDGTAVQEPGTQDSRAWFVIRPEQITFIEQVLPAQDDEEWN